MTSIPGTSVPAVTWGTTGFVAPQPSAVLAGVQADINAAFGGTLSYTLNTPQGQVASTEAAVINYFNQLFQYYTQQVDPAYSSGRMQDAICRIYDLERDPAEPTVLQIACVGSGAPIPEGSVITDNLGNIYACTAAVTLPSAGGSVTTSFACTVAGPVPVPGATSVTIYQAIPGWDSVSVVSGVQGVDQESRSALEQRREDTVAGNSFGAIGSIIGAVAKVPGVIDFFGYNNNTAGSVSVGGVSIAAYSIYICVAGGAPSAVAQAIFSKKGAGAPMIGNTSVTVYDSNPLYATPIAYTILYQIPTNLPVLFKVSIPNGQNVPSDAALQVQNALVAAFTQGVIAGSAQVLPGLRARIGQAIYATRYVPAISALGTWAQVAAIGIGSANTPDAQVVGHIAGTLMTVTSITSGTLAVGQNLSDPANGLIVNGTTILSQASGTPGSTGTYNVNNTQTVAGATFTGTGSGTNLTASAVTGTIGIGDVISGTGVPGGTTLLSQSSGTPGGAGVYVTSGATTSSGNAIAANTPIVAASADQSVVSVQANQEPQLAPVNIVVALI